MSDHDIACITLNSPLDWAERGQMPDTLEHFRNVAQGLLKPAPLRWREPVEPQNLQSLDMARCASEVRLELR